MIHDGAAADDERTPARGPRIAASVFLTTALLATSGLAFALQAPVDDSAGYRAFLHRSGEPFLLTEAGNKVAPMTVTVATAGIRGTVLALTEDTARGLMSVIGTREANPDLLVERSYATQVQADGSVLATTMLSLLDGDGYSTGVVAGSNGFTMTYTPPRVELPAEAVPGTAWSSEGAMNLDSPFTFRGTVGPAESRDGRRCINVDTALVQQNPRATPYTRTTQSTWCDESGPVESSNFEDGRRFSMAPPGSVALPPVEPPQPEPLPPGLTLPGPFPHADVALRPVVVDGLIITTKDSTGDLRAVRLTPRGQQVAWVQHPGGEILGMAADDSLIYVTTAARLLLAFDAAGQIHWLARLPDAAVGAPARMGDVVAVALLDGTTRAYSRIDGSERWSDRLDDTIAVPPVTAGTTIVSADVSGLITATRADGTAAWSRTVAGVRAPMTPLDDGSVLLQDTEHELHVIDSRGEDRWTADLDETVTGEGLQLGTVAVLPAEAGILGIRLGDGTAAWRIDTPGRPAIGGSARFAAGAMTGRFSAEGGLADSGEIPSGDARSRRHTWPLTVGGQHLVMDASGAVTVIGDG